MQNNDSTGNIFSLSRFALILSLVMGFANVTSAAPVYEGTNVPYVHPRSEWLTTPELQNLFSWYPYSPKPEGEIPDYYPVSRIVIHDTGCNVSRPGCNDESIDAKTLIQNIFRFHAVTRAWGDIGYHYIIDRQGEIWEGRYGGNGVRGAHVYNNGTCQNFNVGTIGISILGNYYDTPIPPAAMESLKKLTAWLAYSNNIDVNARVTTTVWSNPKNASNVCSADMGGFTTSFTGPTVLTHRELEANNSDIRSMDFASLWGGSSTFKEEINTYAFQEQGTGSIFDVVQAKLQALTTTAKKIVTVIKSQLDIFRPELFARKPEVQPAPVANAPVLQFADGTLVKAAGKEEVYLVKSQKRVHISSAALFEGLGLSWPTIKEVPETTVSSLAMADPIVFPDGILLQAQTPDVYYIKDSKRFLISSPDQFSAYQFNWNDIIQLTRGELDRYYPWGGYVRWPEGTILQNTYNPAQVVVISAQGITPVEGVAKGTPVYAVSGREISSYQSAQVSTPGLALAFAQAFDAVKQKLGLAASGVITNPNQAAQASDTPIPTPTPAPAPPSQPTVSQPTIKIGLCKTRNTGGDMNKCAFAPSDVLHITTDANGITTVDGYYDNPAFNTALNDNAFRGKVYTVIEGDKVWLVNELPMEEYLKGIAETLGNDNPEYRKVLITIARTYAYYYLTQDKKYPGLPFDLINLSYSQVYRGYLYELRSNGLPAMVDATRGQIVTFNKKPIVGAYSSDSGGITKNACPAIFAKYCNADGMIKAEFTYLKGGIVDPEGTAHNQAKIAASHGVGMSAIGARTMIDAGSAFAEVIKYYYPGVDIQKFY